MRSNSKSLAAILALTTTISPSLAENVGGVVVVEQRNTADEEAASGAASSNDQRRLRHRHSSTTRQQQQQQSGVRRGTTSQNNQQHHHRNNGRRNRKLTRNNANNPNKANRQHKKKGEEAQQQQQQQEEQASDATAAEQSTSNSITTATHTTTAANKKDANSTSRTFATSSSSTSTSAAAPGCGPSPGTHHSPYLGCFTDKPSSRAFSFELYANSSKSKRFNHGTLDCERECTSRGYRFIGRQFKGQCFCGDESDLERVREYTTGEDERNNNGNGGGGCDCCGGNVGGGKMCVWENANHPNSQAQAPNIPVIVPAVQHQSQAQQQMQQQPVHHVQVSSTSSSSATSLSIANNSYSNQVMRPNSSSSIVSSTTNNSNSNKQPIQVSTSKPIGAFRLRLHWQPGYNWQNSPHEKFWCMECRGQCINNAKIQIDKCSSTDIRQKFIAIGRTIRPASNPALCLTIDSMKGGTSNPVKLKYCSNSSPAAQSFDEVKGNGKFELQPKNGLGSRCLSQHHHPKPHEVVFPEKCDKTRMHDTTYWRTY